MAEVKEGMAEVKAEAEAMVAEDTLLSSLYTCQSSITKKSTNNPRTQQQQQQTTPCSITVSLTAKKTLGGDENLVMVDVGDENNLLLRLQNFEISIEL